MGRLYAITPSRAAAIPGPGDWEFRHSDRPSHDAPMVPDVDRTEPEVVARLLGPDGSTIRAWSDRPPVGFQCP